ncbi:MAG: phenylacetate--CoA ligase family protein [Chloroflexi bacterium]|nr:phenylacetate--CoA ligase family protein [Chloroflexota bacterium]
MTLTLCAVPMRNAEKEERGPSLISRLYWTAWLWRQSRQAVSDTRSIRHPTGGQLQELVTLAYEQTEYYRQVMQRAGLHPADIRTPAHLARFPITGRQALQERPHAFRPKSVAGPGLVIQSSGSTGQPVAVRYDEKALLQNMAASRREWKPLAHTLTKPGPLRKLSIQPPGPTRFDRIHAFCHQRVWVPANFLPKRHTMPMSTDFAQIVESMNHIRPDLLVALGSFVDAFFQQIHDRQLSFHPPRAIQYFSDHLGDRTRRLLRDVYNIPVFGTYTAVESLKLGYECEAHQGFHLHPDLCLVRIVDKAGADVPEGELGDVVITNLFNRGTLLINYRLGDLGRVTYEPCACGRTSPRLTRLEGRIDEVLEFPDGRRISAFSFLYPLFERNGAPGIRQYQAVQLASDRLEMRIVPTQDADWPSLAHRLKMALRQQLGRQIHVEMQKVAHIDPEPWGKTRRFIRLPGDSG